MARRNPNMDGGEVYNTSSSTRRGTLTSDGPASANLSPEPTVPNDPILELEDVPDLEPVIEVINGTTVTRENPERKAARMRNKITKAAFMAEMVTVVVHESTDRNAPPCPIIRVNNRSQMFVRGRAQRVKRMYVEGLARAKPGTVRTRVAVQQESNEKVVRLTSSRAVRYPFSVLHDPNPRGREWLERILAQP